MVSFTVVSWNVLADAYVRPHYYPHVNPALLRAGARTQAIVEQVVRFAAEVVCLQEVEPALVAALRARGLAVQYAQKRGRPEGCAIVSTLPTREVRTIAFSDGAPDRTDSGHVALFASIAGVTIATTHLRWDKPGTPSNDRWATREALQLIGQLGGPPSIACGDFNFEPDDEVYQLFGAAGLTDAAALKPTANPNGRARRIDYLLASGLSSEALPVMAVDDATPLPSEAMPSDHVPIAARFESVGA